MKARGGLLIGLLAAAFLAAPLGTAGAQDPTGTDVTEGSVPPGGTVNCSTAPDLDPDHGPPGTVVTVTATFEGNCDEFNPGLFGTECTGTVSGGIEEFTFPITISPETPEPRLSGEFVAPATEPQPPVPDAIEPLSVTITCSVAGSCSAPAPAQTQCSPGAEGFGGTTYVYPAVNYDLELFTDEGEQPTLVEDDRVEDAGVVSATPTFTG